MNNAEIAGHKDLRLKYIESEKRLECSLPCRGEKHAVVDLGVKLVCQWLLSPVLSWDGGLMVWRLPGLHGCIGQIGEMLIRFAGLLICRQLESPVFECPVLWGEGKICVHGNMLNSLSWCVLDLVQNSFVGLQVQGHVVSLLSRCLLGLVQT